MRSFFLVVLIALALVPVAHAADPSPAILCSLAGPNLALGAHGDESPVAILSEILAKVHLSFRNITPIPTSSSLLHENAYVVHCDQSPVCDCLIYDPNFISVTPGQGDAAWEPYFVLAHEVGHYVLHHLDDPSIVKIIKEQEADHWAGGALESLGAPISGVMAGVDHISIPPTGDASHYPRCQRRMDALDGYNEAAKADGQTVYDKCMGCFAIDEKGLYANQEIPAGAVIARDTLTTCGANPSRTDAPADFDRDVRGACAVTSLKQSDRITWHNIGLCQR